MTALAAGGFVMAWLPTGWLLAFLTYRLSTRAGIGALLLSIITAALYVSFVKGCPFGACLKGISLMTCPYWFCALIIQRYQLRHVMTACLALATIAVSVSALSHVWHASLEEWQTEVLVFESVGQNAGFNLAGPTFASFLASYWVVLYFGVALSLSVWAAKSSNQPMVGLVMRPPSLWPLLGLAILIAVIGHFGLEEANEALNNALFAILSIQGFVLLRCWLPSMGMQFFAFLALWAFWPISVTALSILGLGQIGLITLRAWYPQDARTSVGENDGNHFT